MPRLALLVAVVLSTTALSNGYLTSHNGSIQAQNEGKVI
jgi:hypothetical protein